MRTLHRLIEYACLSCYVIAMFAQYQYKAPLLLFPASFSVGIIIGRWIMNSHKDRLIDDAIENQKSMSPEKKAKLDRLMKEVIGELGVKLEKCGDPHCPNCHGYGDN